MESPEKYAERRVRELATESGKVALTTHARKRMHQRHITLPQVLETLRDGDIDEAFHREANGFWTARFCRWVAGDRVFVVARLDDSGAEIVVVITVIV